jgi:hypothetical protein
MQPCVQFCSIGFWQGKETNATQGLQQHREAEIMMLILRIPVLLGSCDVL